MNINKLKSLVQKSVFQTGQIYPNKDEFSILLLHITTWEM